MTRAAAVGPRAGQGAHRGGLAGPGGRDRQLQPGTGGGHLAHQRGLSGVEGDAVRGRLQQRQVDRRTPSTANPSWRPAACDQALLGGQHRGRGEQVGPGLGVDRGPVDAAQLGRAR